MTILLYGVSKPFRRVETKEELTKELATKADIAETMAEIERVRAEVKVLEVKFTAELRLIKLWLIILTVLVVVFNRDALGLILEIVKLIK